MTSKWESTYSTTTEGERSWSEQSAETSLAWIDATEVSKDLPVADIGGGASRLVDGLLERGYREVTVVDLSATALREARARVGDRATFVEADLLSWNPPKPLGLWHDRAVLHFFTSSEQRQAYAHHVAEVVAPGGAVVIGCFSPHGPEQCSGLPVHRASAEELGQLFGPRFSLDAAATVVHVTPWGSSQSFTWVRLTRLGEQLDA